MRLLTRLLAPKSVAHAHCDLPCGVYDPAQAKIEAQSVKAILEKYAANGHAAQRFARSSAVSSETWSQPSVATRPCFASMPSTT